jgi:hypothetical protein
MGYKVKRICVKAMLEQERFDLYEEICKETGITSKSAHVTKLVNEFINKYVEEHKK